MCVYDINHASIHIGCRLCYTYHMDKEEHSRKIDELIISGLSGSKFDKVKVLQLVTDYAHEFLCPYKISAESMRSLATDAERERAQQLEDGLNKLIMSKLKNKPLNLKLKQKQAYSREMDGLINKCAIGVKCDESELVRLAIEYAHEFRSYEWHGDLVESDEREVAVQMEAKVNKVIAKTLQRKSAMGAMGAMGRLAMERFSMQPSPNPRDIMRPCKCAGPNQSPDCKMPVALCKTAMHAFSRTVPRTPSPKSPKSPKSRKSKGGKHKSKSCKSCKSCKRRSH